MARRLLWTVLSVVGALLAIGTTSIPLLDTDEARYARTSVEMLRAGDMVMPRFAGLPRLVKPPLIHWIQGFLFHWLGASPAAARLHALASTLGIVLLTSWIARARFGPEAGVWAAAIVGTMPLVLVVGRMGTIDALLSIHVLAVLALDLTAPPGGRRHDALAIGGLLGLAFLAKGPVGVVLPLLMLLAGRAAAGRRVGPSAIGAAQAIGAWLLVVLPWALPFLHRVGVEAIANVVRGEVIEPYLAGRSHVESAWFYPVVLLVGFFPWAGPIVLALGRAFRRQAGDAAPTARYAAAALLAGLVLLTLGKNKVPTYVLPLAPLAALLATWELGATLREARARQTGTALVAAALGAAALALALALRFHLPEAGRQLALAGAPVCAAGALAAGWATIAARPRWVHGIGAATSALLMLLAFLLLLPEIGRRRSSGGLVREVPALAGEAPVVTVSMEVPSLAFYLDRVPEIVSIVDLPARLSRPDSPLFVFDEDDLPATPPETLALLQEIGRQGKYRVFAERRLTGPAGRG